MKYPEGYLWENPGFPSLMVSYLKTNDFFFSGHVGLPVILLSEFIKINKNIMAVLAFIIVILEFFTMVALRGHYSIDLFTGIFVAHYCHLMTDKFIYIIDDITMKKPMIETEIEQDLLTSYKTVKIDNNNMSHKNY